MKINDLSYNAEGRRCGYNGTHEQDKELNADGNYLNFGDFGYDTCVAMRRNQEPLRAYTPSKSNYIAYNCNPIIYQDIDGNWASLINTKYKENDRFIGYKIVQTRADIASHITKQLNKTYYLLNKKGRHYAPNIAEYIKNTQIDVIMLDMTKRYNDKTSKNEKEANHNEGIATPISRVIGLEYNLYTRNMQNMESSYIEKVFIHEVLHKASDKNKEFQVRAGMFYLGFDAKNEIMEQFSTDIVKATENLLSSFNKYFIYNNKNKNKPVSFNYFLNDEIKENFYNDFFNYGKEIVNKVNNSNNENGDSDESNP